MLIRTHLAIAVLFTLLFIPSVSQKFIFALVVLIASYIPDVDSGFSRIGSVTGTGVVRFFTRHRGVMHSFTLCIIFSFILAVFIPVLALPFFLGYGLHLFADSLTVDGIKPFWPSKKSSAGIFKTGSFTETGLFVVLIIIDLLVFVYMLYNVF